MIKNAVREFFWFFLRRNQWALPAFLRFYDRELPRTTLSFSFFATAVISRGTSAVAKKQT